MGNMKLWQDQDIQMSENLEVDDVIRGWHSGSNPPPARHSAERSIYRRHRLFPCRHYMSEDGVIIAPGVTKRWQPHGLPRIIEPQDHLL